MVMVPLIVFCTACTPLTAKSLGCQSNYGSFKWHTVIEVKMMLGLFFYSNACTFLCKCKTFLSFRGLHRILAEVACLDCPPLILLTFPHWIRRNGYGNWQPNSNRCMPVWMFTTYPGEQEVGCPTVSLTPPVGPNPKQKIKVKWMKREVICTNA